MTRRSAAVAALVVDDYIAARPPEAQKVLKSVRKIWHDETPNSGEGFKYQMPMITLEGESLVYFAGWKNHLGMYPIPRGDAAFEASVRPYRSDKDTVKFPYEDPLPEDVIRLIARFVVDQRLRRSGG
jgi:uncharacterized protein YdhG (YjbR/CyaY superfamily)